MNKFFFAIALLIFGSGLSAQESDWNFHSEVGLGIINYDYWEQFDSRSGPYYNEKTLWLPALYVSTHIRYKRVGLDIDSYNGGVFPGASLLISSDAGLNQLFVTYKLTNAQLIGLGSFDRQDFRHGPGLKVRLNRINMGAFYSFIPIEKGDLVGEIVYRHTFRMNMSYTFLKRPRKKKNE